MARGDDGALIDPHGGAGAICARRAAPCLAGVRRGSAARASRRALRRALRLRRRAGDRGAAAQRSSRPASSRRSRRSASGRSSRRGLCERIRRACSRCCASCGALAALLPEVDALFGVPQPPQHHREIDTGVHVMQALDFAAQRGYGLAVRYAVLTHDLGKAASPPDAGRRTMAHEACERAPRRRLSERLRVPVDCRDVARLAARWHGVLRRSRAAAAGQVARSADRRRCAAPPAAPRRS